MKFEFRFPVFCFSWVLFLTFGLANSAVLAQTEDASTNSNEVTNSQDQAKAEIVDVLITELNQLIPGDYESGSEQSLLIENIAKGVVEKNKTKMDLYLDDLGTSDPKVPPRELLLAGIAYATNNAANGQAILQRAAVKYPNHPAIGLAFCRLALSQNRYFEALVMANKAKDDNQSTADEVSKRHYDIGVFDALAVIELRRQQFDNALKHAGQWEALDPDSNKMLMATAEIYFMQNKIDVSNEYLNKRSTESITTTPSELIIAKWYQAKRDNENYTKWVSAAYEKHSGNNLVQIEYAAWLLRREKFAETLSVADTHEKEFGKSNESLLLRARVAFSKQEYSEAERILEELLTNQPNNFEYSYLYTLSLLESTNVDKQKQAAQIAQRNFQLRRNNQLAIATFGWALLVNGDKANATELLTRAKNTGVMLPDTAYMVAKLMQSEERKFQAQRILEPYVNTKEVFIFRSRAKAMLSEIAAEGQGGDLPTPSTSGSSDNGGN